mmetsp:Transcript_46408/g.100942  ORF Transcript_46408/g.100942 Transcript_46408/m.100942 type:complete len:222 (-) Transcript_46408:141-806(-)
MNPYAGYGAFPGGFSNGYGGMGGPFPQGSCQEPWWGAAGYRDSGVADAGEGMWGGHPAKGSSKSGEKGAGKGLGKRSVMCKFFLEGRCTRGASCAFSHEDGKAGAFGAEEEDSDPDLTEFQASMEQAQGKRLDDVAAMASFEKEEEDRWNQLRNATNSGDSDNGDALPPPATELEVEEARCIVQKAQREAEEREIMKTKAKTASRSDLEAMINARIASCSK